MDRLVAEEWIEAYVRPIGPIELTHERPWSTVLRVPLAKGVAWFKACNSLHAFEPRLTAELSARWPDRVPEVLAFDGTRGWLLMADAGVRIGELGNLPTYWLEILPLYSELQRGEVAHTPEHLEHGVPDFRVDTLPAHYHELLEQDPPLSSDDLEKLRTFAPRFERLCRELSSQPIPDTIQHDDLHMNNVYAQGEGLRVLDWGDSSVSHPFASLVATFRFLEERNGITDDDPWRARIRDAYLEPWGSGLTEVFDVAQRVGTFAHAIAAMRQRAALDGAAGNDFDQDLVVRLQRALALVTR
ncbi:MAG TPA: phosphotransferase [Acidimicrobiales bacterium]|nr:phosphotransferase [Acidimicrobiales bacterium]